MPTKPTRTQDDPHVSTALLTEKEVLARVRTSRPTLTRWRKNANFPRPLKMHEGGGIRWLANEVDAWIASRPRA